MVRRAEAIAKSRPYHGRNVRQFAVGDELVLVMSFSPQEGGEAVPDGRALTLNASGRAVWDLCNGRRSVTDIADALAESFSIDRTEMVAQVGQALLELSHLGFIENFDPSELEKL